MNLKFADRLVELRKANGLSQEALAEKLGLSRQSISKWERGESSPDTDNLVSLAQVYGMTLDELLGNSSAGVANRSNANGQKPKKQLSPVQKQGIKMFKMLPFVVIGIIVVYVLGGMAAGRIWWSNLWLLFFIIPIYATVATAFTAGASKRLFWMLLTIPVGISAVMLYLMSGLYLNLWGVAWIIFLAIPTYAYIALLKTKK